MRTAIRLLFAIVLSLTFYAHAQQAQLTVQQMCARGGSSNTCPSVAETTGPVVSTALPIPESWQIQCTINQAPNNIGLTTVALGQFRCLNAWPKSGYARNVQVDFETTLSTVDLLAGGQGHTCTVGSTDPYCLHNSGVKLCKTGTAGCSAGGNFGGSNMASIASNVVTVDTGAAIFKIKGANFNWIDDIQIGATHLVYASNHGTDDGLVLGGPTWGGKALGVANPNYAASCDDGAIGSQPGGSTGQNIATFTPGLESGCGTKYRSNNDAGGI